MNRIAHFEKVSEKQFYKDGGKYYDNIIMPKRATSGSAGYDIKSPFSVELRPGEGITVPTGLRCFMDTGWVMLILPKSGLGFKYRLQLDNTVGVIDSDYYNADNEGHILVKITNDSKSGRTLCLEAGKAFAQAVFLPFGITEDDEAAGLRHGGFGSTDA